MCQHGTRFQRRYLDWRATVTENATHIASERIHSTASSDQINNYKHVRNRLFERNKIGRTYLWTKFAKLSCPKLWAVRSPRDGPQRYSAESFWKLYVELTRILRERPQWLARDKHSISGKGNGIMGFARFQAKFRVYFEFRNVLRTIPYSSPWRGRVENIWGITWFSGGTMGDHLFPQVYKADYKCDCH